MLYCDGMNSPESTRILDAAIVGGGPAGLAAAVYLGRFLRSSLVFDSGEARAKLIPRTHNCPGFPDGVTGEELLSRLRKQATTYGAQFVAATVERIERQGEHFVLSTGAETFEARCLILATGIVDKMPPLPGLEDAIASGTVRLCPICDAYEAQGKRIGIIGPDELALREAIFLKDYSPHVTLLFRDGDEISGTVRQEAAARQIEVLDRVERVVPRDDSFEIMTSADAPPRAFDLLYPSMGCNVRSELAVSLGAACDEDGYVAVDEHLQTTVPGLFAIGDLAKALNQIAVGFGHAALASTHIHNILRHSAKPNGSEVSA